jgi:electron transfer flavoprotein alpha subunit
MILVVAEQRDGRLNRASWEAVAAAQQLATGDPVVVVLPTADAQPAGELSAAAVDELIALRHTALGHYTSDAYVQALAAFVTDRDPSIVVLPHTYQTRDFAPALAARVERALITDCTALRLDQGRVVCSRPMFQAKLAADVVPSGPSPHFVSVQLGAFRVDMVVRRPDAVAVQTVEAQIDSSAIRQRPEPPFQEARQAVDLAQAERIVAVGRGIRGQEHLDLVERLAAALGAELGASRPICDAGWLPMERQIGSSGQTVAPKLYVAVGVSGAIQHLVGMKGSRTIVAINKDRDAPIFEVADYGIVGDLFEVVPAILEALQRS